MNNVVFSALKMGDIVTIRLVESFHKLMDYSFTANLEEELDEIAAGKKPWTNVLDTFYKEFLSHLKEAEETMRGSDPIDVPSLPCSACGRPMCLRVAKTGVFLGCSGYSLPPKERCTETVNLIPGEEVESYSEDDDEGNLQELEAKKRCPKCEVAMDSYLIDQERRLHICGHSPDCSGVLLEKEASALRVMKGLLFHVISAVLICS